MSAHRPSRLVTALVSTSSKTVMVLVVTAACLRPSPATAATIQLSTEVNNNPSTLCGDSTSTTNVATQSTLAQSCTIGTVFNGLGQARGVFDSTGLSLGASYSLSATGDVVIDLAFAESIATFSDSVTLTGGTTGALGYLSMTFAVDGSLSGSLHTIPYATLSLNDTADLADGTTNVTLVAPFFFDQVTPFHISLTAGALLVDTVQVTGASLNADADFYNTAILSSLQVLDENMNVIEGGRLVSASGLTYPDSAAAVPEPASITLLGLGLAGMGARRWRQRKA